VVLVVVVDVLVVDVRVVVLDVVVSATWLLVCVV
jgi:hypothetical protein